jgi:hypothetical protein
MAKKQQRPVGTWRYILRAELTLPPEEQTVFVLRPLTQLERADVKDNMVRIHHQADGGVMKQQRDARILVELCASHIHAIENFPVGGTPEAWPDEPAARLAYLDQLDDADVQEVGDEIWVRSAIGLPEKNSSPPRPTSSSVGALAENDSTTASSVS